MFSNKCKTTLLNANDSKTFGISKQITNNHPQIDFVFKSFMPCLSVLKV